MNIRCLSCGHTIDLDDAYSDYEGQIKCYTCQALLAVKMSDNIIRSVNLYRQAAADIQEEEIRGNP
jgi:hypothetical protein